MSGNYNSLYKNARRHLRKTKEKMIQPFDREVGKKGAPIDAGIPVSEERKIEVKEQLQKQFSKTRLFNGIMIIITAVAMYAIFWFLIGSKL